MNPYSALVEEVLDCLFELPGGQHVYGGVGDAVQELEENYVVAYTFIQPTDCPTHTDHGDYPEGYVGHHDGDQDQADGLHCSLVSHKCFLFLTKENNVF